MQQRRKQYDNSNRIAVWDNDDRGGGKPEFKGSATEIECPCCGKSSDYWVSLWQNDNGRGNAPIYSGKLQPKDEAPPARNGRDRDDREPVRGRGRDDRHDERPRGRSAPRDQYDERNPPPRDRYEGPDDLDSEIPF